MRAAVKRDRYSLVGMTVRPSPVVNFFAPAEEEQASTLLDSFSHLGILTGGQHTNCQIVKMEHGDAGLHKGPGHFHRVRESAESHVPVGDDRGQKVPVVQSLALGLVGVQESELPLPLVLPLLGPEDLVDRRGDGVPRVICVVHPRLADLRVAAQCSRDVDGLSV